MTMGGRDVALWCAVVAAVVTTVATGPMGGKYEKIAPQQLSHITAKLRLPRFVNGNDPIPSNQMCKENDKTYKVGELIYRGCEETCECKATGVFDCSPRCDHSYVSREEKLTDPYCHLSPVDECCALIACASG
ncbi:unnamed protein product [Parnassius apollo]|uniref:(apollo) hypothetical protein n=1 Tax=Parnassius apollo TaxID=110799 RepID=A0A8S3W0I4_PARAO|nr:unnamed protein product [Parnassius apollo]